LQALTLVSALPTDAAMRLLQGSEAERDARLAALLEDGLLMRAFGTTPSVTLADAGMRRGLADMLLVPDRAALAAELLAQPDAHFDAVDRATLAVAAGDVGAMCREIPEAIETLNRIGAQARAAELLETLRRHAPPEQRATLTLRLASLRHALAQDEIAAELASQLAESAETHEKQKTEAYLLAARALTALGRWNDAVEALGRVPANLDPAERAQVQRELAKIHLRRGDYEAVASAVDAGLACAPEADPVRVELLCSRGIVASYAGDQAAARQCYEQALALARSKGARSDEANVLTYLAIGCHRAGDMIGARDLLAQSLEIARELGDVGSMARFSMNLGVVFYHLGESAVAAEHYASAARLARRAGRTSTRVHARANLAHLHIYFGLYESARAEIEEVLVEAQAASQRATVAQLTALSAELMARTGEVDRALIGYDDALTRFAALGRTREIIEHNLDAAETLLDRAGPADGSAAAAYLARAREHLAREQADDLRQRLDLLVARARLESGEPDAAARALEDVVERARAARSRDVEWSALTALAVAQERCGALFAAKHSARAAVEVIEDIALRVPREHRDAFWHDPRRRIAREYANRSEHLRPSTHGSTPNALSSDAFRQERERLFQILRRLASEHDVSRLLERIIESAVDLSGAEHGSVLLVDDKGELSPQLTHARPALSDQAHETFSRSIAEAVLIDGEPIVTVDALSDGRLQSYVSVHKLMLRSVACLPIRGHASTLGVLYLEHRRSRGRFSDEAVDLLSAFADQAAIALENARMLKEIRTQKDELERANQDLQEAKAQLEELLLARTRQLDDVQRELANVMQRDVQSPRHGMVGKSAGIQRLLDGITRVSASSVPVVICGETGTGKELVARAIHEASTRATGPFVTINCGSLPETLLESELFGYVKGAFSGADRDRRGLIGTASGGTLFLDEVSEMSPKMQASLLRVLQERKLCRVGSEVEEPIDVRILCSTRKPLSGLVASGQFREDLMYRLSVVELQVPPLRDRREDIPLLCDHLLREFAARESVPRCHLTRAALAALMDQPWPGNVRQLGHVLLQACVMSESTTLQLSDLSVGESITPPSQAPRSELPATLPPVAVESLNHHKLEEKQRILHALEAAGWNRVKAAQALGMPRRTFYRRLSDYSII
jgi:transcriptional regulator with GAF, ATPase, and Fis domain